MYHITYTSSENEELYDNTHIYNYKYIDDDRNYLQYMNKSTNDNHICIICLSILHNNKPSHLLHEHTGYTFYCNCNPFIHLHCLQEWYTKSNTCPICREFIIYDALNTSAGITNLTFLGYYIILYNYTMRVFHIAKIVAIANMALVVIYNFYYIYYFAERSSYNFDQVL